MLDCSSRVWYLLRMGKKAQERVKPVTFREFPTDLYWLAKQCAASREMTFKDYVIAVLREATDRDRSSLGK
jgi:hypothetical protein